MIVFRCPFWLVVAFGLLCLRLGHHWVRVRRAWLGRLAGATYQQRRGQNRSRDQAEPAGHQCTSLRGRVAWCGAHVAWGRRNRV